MISPPGASRLVFKVMTSEDCAAARLSGAYGGSADDLRDGFIHLSAPHQLAGTLAKHYRGRANLILVAFDAGDLGGALQWEVSRGGDLFPHLYAPLPMHHALWQRPLDLDAEGVPRAGKDWLT